MGTRRGQKSVLELLELELQEGCEILDVDSGIWIQVLYKSITTASYIYFFFKKKTSPLTLSENFLKLEKFRVENGVDHLEGMDWGMLGEPGNQVCFDMLNRHLSPVSLAWDLRG